MVNTQYGLNDQTISFKYELKNNANGREERKATKIIAITYHDKADPPVTSSSVVDVLAP